MIVLTVTVTTAGADLAQQLYQRQHTIIIIYCIYTTQYTHMGACACAYAVSVNMYSKRAAHYMHHTYICALCAVRYMHHEPRHKRCAIEFRFFFELVLVDAYAVCSVQYVQCVHTLHAIRI